MCGKGLKRTSRVWSRVLRRHHSSQWQCLKVCFMALERAFAVLTAPRAKTKARVETVWAYETVTSTTTITRTYSLFLNTAIARARG
ncbi:hypothetical protein AOQ84DRAFT_179898 [Glonium stellatum]|uniref:Uncharacterized protein n=1 Tax=Glonium stellatum TaxID=574774 RepID=A0A8E2EPJ3_9PEZI|nr:hypothetical protein AOQ84DRAFT_179898 [Glonium stellatum]